MKILKTLFIGIIALALATAPAYGGGPKEKGRDKGKAKGHEKQAQKGNQSSNAQTTRDAPERRSNKIERDRNQANLRTNRPARIDRGRSADHFGKKETKDKIDSLSRAFNALKHAEWAHNPHDKKGQGNMGKSKIKDTYGLDKDSDREKNERNRPILEAIESVQEALSKLLNMPDITSINFTTRKSLRDKIKVNRTDTINYNLTFSPPDKLDGIDLLVTTSLTSTNDYNSYTRVYDSTTRRWDYVPIHYNAGEVVMEQIQEVTLGTDTTISFSYDPPSEMAGYTGFYGELTVTVTEPISGANYTMTYDRQLYLYRCLYDKGYNTKTH